MDFDKKVKKILFEIGLSSIQSDFYLTLLKNGPSPVSKIAKTLGINRTNSYVIVDKLKEMDFVWEENKPQGKVLHGKSYKMLLQALDKREKEIKNYHDTITSLAPIFDSFTTSQNVTGPKVKLFQSKQGLSTLVDEILSSAENTKEILLFTNQDTEKGFFSKKSHDDFIRRRVNHTIRIKVLAANNVGGRHLKAEDSKYLRETRFLPEGFNFGAEIYIFNNRISMIDIKEEIIGIVIESEELYKIHAQLFQLIWNMAS